MFWAEYSPVRRACMAMAAGSLLLATAAQAAIVVASSGPSAASYPAGKKLDDGQTITLRAGDSVTVLDGHGTRVLKGAGQFPVAGTGATAGASSTFAALTMQRSAQRVRTGAVRAVGGQQPGNPNLWFIDIAQPGTHCIVGPESVDIRLWRANTASAATYILTDSEKDGKSGTIAFPAGEMVAPWDGNVRVHDGGHYRLSDGKGAPVSTIDLAIIDQQPVDPEATAAALIQHGCQAQLDLLSATLKTP